MASSIGGSLISAGSVDLRRTAGATPLSVPWLRGLHADPYVRRRPRPSAHRGDSIPDRDHVLRNPLVALPSPSHRRCGHSPCRHRCCSSDARRQISTSSRHRAGAPGRRNGSVSTVVGYRDRLFLRWDERSEINLPVGERHSVRRDLTADQLEGATHVALPIEGH